MSGMLSSWEKELACFARLLWSSAILKSPFSLRCSMCPTNGTRAAATLACSTFEATSEASRSANVRCQDATWSPKTLTLDLLRIRAAVGPSPATSASLLSSPWSASLVSAASWSGRWARCLAQLLCCAIVTRFLPGSLDPAPNEGGVPSTPSNSLSRALASAPRIPSGAAAVVPSPVGLVRVRVRVGVRVRARVNYSLGAACRASRFACTLALINSEL